MRRIWLPEIGLFETLPNLGEGSCLFQAISQAICYSLKHHNDVRMATVDHMCSDRWSEKLKELPAFWKHKMIVEWLAKQTDMAKCADNDNPSLLRTLLLHICPLNLVRKKMKRRKARRYLRVKGLLHSKENSSSQYLHDLQLIFRDFMSQTNEPATRFELEAAANRFRFHFDYLQTIPIAKESFKPFQDDIDNNNKKEEGIESSPANDALPQIPQMPDIPVKLSMYQFHSCRNSGCTFPRSCPTYEHFFFLHSPVTSNSDNCYKSSTPLLSPNDEHWHWELLLPIGLWKNPVPLNRRMFGMEYNLDDDGRQYTISQDGRYHETLDSVAEAIDIYLHNNPGFLPPEDSQWPSDDGDDYTGCAKIMKDPMYKIHSRFQSNCIGVVRNREHIIMDFKEASNT